LTRVLDDPEHHTEKNNYTVTPKDFFKDTALEPWLEIVKT
jgi:hypothetical protein